MRACCRKAITARISVEQASTFGWSQYVGQAGKSLGMRTFGASAPLKELQKRFGFTPEAVMAAAREMLGKSGYLSDTKPLRKKINKKKKKKKKKNRNQMKITIGSDHAGFALKKVLIEHLPEKRPSVN